MGFKLISLNLSFPRSRLPISWIREVFAGRSRCDESREQVSCNLDEVASCLPVHSHTKTVAVSAEHLSRNRILLDNESYAAEQFKVLRTQVFGRTRAKGWNTIQVTGFDAGAGKSLVALNLAISIAKDPRQTALLVELDFRNPTIGSLLRLNPRAPGLDAYFFESMRLEDILINPGIEKLTVLPAGSRIMHASEVIGSGKMECLVKELKERYPDRYIIFDTPPLNDFPDAVVFSEYVDSLLLVARSGHTTRDDVKRAMGVIPREKVLGMVLNDVAPPKPDDMYRPGWRWVKEIGRRAGMH